MSMEKRAAQRWLSGSWILFSLALGAILFVQSEMFEVYGGNEAEVWDWFVHAVVPTATLMLGVVMVDVAGKAEKDKRVDVFVFGVALVLSVVYLLAVLAVLVLAALKYSLDPVAGSERYLPVLHGLVSTAIGAFFVIKPDPGGAAAAGGRPGPGGSGGSTPGGR